MNDEKRPDVVAITIANSSTKGMDVAAYFDCSAPISEPCENESLGDYFQNSISINGKTLHLGGQLNGDNVSRFNIGRFFQARDHQNRFLIFEMADIDCPNVSNNYCYIIISLDKKDKMLKHSLYNKENNPITEEELSTILIAVKKLVNTDSLKDSVL